jgi:hypothetical protein
MARAVSKIVRIPIRVIHEPTAQAVNRRRMHAEQTRDDPRLTTRQRPPRERARDFRNPPLALARRLVSKHRATPSFRTVARPLSTLWAFARSLILDAIAVATLPQQKLRPN